MAGIEKNSIEEIRNQLGEDGLEKLRACESDEERVRLMGEYGIELPDELLDGISGGGVFDWLRYLAKEGWNGINDLFS